ncbi:ABC transporter substrate-binding protein [Vibrio sp. SCSIO 43140]|uniref:ABC transporter substrate-binding protein n=1 Tax=Vibrio sp. SCSIO 43140 TaxID=2819100 RepID=UPI002074C10F|nr:ABC transporter substrate-binding protein [Vibrio sp. SCSIO 43140]USD63288.1 ABC transporter substrate-binding protein [Vibrio sp. SCSIO 43140]
MFNRFKTTHFTVVLVSLLACLSSFAASAKTYQHELGTVEINKAPKRVVVLDWALAESVLALGVTPIASADVKGYQDWVGSPTMPSEVTDVGSRREPNLELIASLKPDLILMSGHLAPAYEKLNAIAPTLVMSIYNDKKQPYQNAKTLVITLGDVFERPEQAQQLVDETNQKLAQNGEQVAKMNNGKPFIMVRFIGDRHIRVHSAGSLMNDTISAMSLENSWQGPTNSWGFSSASVEQLAQYQDSNVLIFGPLSDAEQAQLNGSPLWAAMAFSRENRVKIVPKVWTFGSLVAMQRLSDEVVSQVSTLGKQ